MRPIDADKFDAVLGNIFDHLYESGRADLAGTLAAFMDILKRQPTIDAVPVVRCEECEFYKPQKKVPRWSGASLFCTRSAVMKFPPDGFCSFGKRKDGGDND